MLQRGLAVLLSICLLAGGSGNTVYAMNPQADMQVVNDVQNGADTEEGSENADAFQNDDAESGSAGESGVSEDGAAGDDGTSEAGTVIDDGTPEDGADADDGVSKDGADVDDGTPEDGADADDGTQENGGDVNDGTPEDGTVTDDGAPEEEPIVDDGTEGDDNPSVSDNDASAGENGGEEQIEVIDTETVSMNAVSVSSIKEEELTLTVDAPQTVTLASQEQQWLSFTAPETGLFRFFSSTEDNSYQAKYVYLCHDKEENNYFDQDYGNGDNGNFNITYRMQAGETIYLLVEFASYSVSGTFTVHAEKVAAPEMTVTKNGEGDYTLQSDSHLLKLVLTSSYTTVDVAVELLQSDGSALTGSDYYKVYYKYSYDSRGGRTQSASRTDSLYSYSGYKSEFGISGIVAGGRALVTELQLRDSSNNILAVLGADGPELAVNTKTTEKLGVLAEVTVEDACISVKPEMISANNGRIRYRKQEESNWTYDQQTIYYHQNYLINLAAEPDTDYVIELTGTDMETVYDSMEVRTKAFAAADILAEATNITSSSATVKVTIGSYTGSNERIFARVSYVDSMGDTKTETESLYVGNIASGISLQLDNLVAGTEYKDLEVELDDTDFYQMEYVAYRTKVSFTTAASAITAEQIAVTVTPDAEDGTKAVLKTALQDVSEGTYSYTVKYRVAGSKDWTESKSVYGTLYASNSYTDEQSLTTLMGNTEYDLLVMVDGITKTASFTTTAAAVAAQVEVEPLMLGVRVKAALTGVLSGSYTIAAHYYDQERCQWVSVSYNDYNSTRLTEDNNWETTVVFYSSDIRPNAENEWKITVSQSYNKIFEKYMTLEAARQEIMLTAENIMCTTAGIKGVLAERDESIRYSSAQSYYRAKDTAQWTEGGYCSYGNAGGSTIYLSDLKEDTEYEFKLVPNKYPDDILAQTTFRTLKDTRNLSVSVDNCRYTSAQVNWTFDSGANVLDNSSYIVIYYRKIGDAAWRFADYKRVRTTTVGKVFLTDLEPGASYEVLAELKDSYNTTPGDRLVKDEKAEFATAAVDHVLKAEPVTEEIKATSAAFIVQLTKATGTLENRAKAALILTPVNGGVSRSKEVFLNRDNQYKTKLVISGLLPGTKYAISAELYESESNQWISLKNYDLGEITTAEADTPGAISLSEAEIVINKGTSKKLTVTVQPEEAAAGLLWSSSDTAVATVDRYGTIAAKKAGEADITVSATGTVAAGQEKVSAVCHVTVRDYEIRVKNENDSYDSIPDILSRAQRRTLVVYDGVAKVDLTSVTWTSSNPHTARISGEGLLEPQNYGKTYITARTTDGITLKTGPVNVVNEIQGFSITRPETENNAYEAIRTAEAVYQVAAGETYRVGCVLSPAYTDRYNSSVGIAAGRFTWTSDKADKDEITFKEAGDGSGLMDIRIPATVSGSVKITAVMKDEEYKDKSFSITLDILKKPEVEGLLDTYTWLDYSNKLADVGLPEKWQWKEQDTLIYEAGMQTFTARYTESGYYPYETDVTVYAERMASSLSVIGNYSASKKAYIVKKDMPLKVSLRALGENIPALLYEQSALAPAAKDAAKVNVSAPDADGYCSVTASAKGTYTVSAAVVLKKAAFEKKDGTYVLVEGTKVKDTAFSVKFMAVDAALIQKITWKVADDSPEKVTISEEGTIEYEITAANADSKQNERVIKLKVEAVDTDGNPVENPQIDYKVSDTAVVKLKKEGNDKLVLTIPKGADGLAKIVATAKDELGRSEQLAVRVKDYTPRVTTYKISVNENYTYGKQIAQIVLPYEEDGSDQIEKISLVETDRNGGTDEVAGLGVSLNGNADRYKSSAYLNVTDKEKIKQKGNLIYYLAIQTKAYGGTVFVPVQIKLETGMPAVTLKQSGKVNVFYTDTTHLTSYDAVSMGLVDISSTASIDSVRWVAGDGSASAVNTEFAIDGAYTSIWKNGKYTKKFMIRQHRPVLDSSKKPSDAAAKGTLYIKLSGYKEEIKKPFTIQTVYKKPKLKAADYKVCPALGEVSDHQYIYTNAAKTNNWMAKGSSAVWKGYSDILCADEEIEIVNGTNVSLRYTGTKDKKTQLTLYSDYWYESLTVLVKVKIAKSKVKLSPSAVTLNKAYPTETTQTAATAWIYNAQTGTSVNVSDVGIVGANAKAQQMLDQSLINMDYMNARLSVSVNYAKAMENNQFKPGSYKYKLTPYYGDTALNGVTLTVKIIDKEAAVKVKTKGSIDLLKLDWYGSDYNDNYSPVVTVTPSFQNLDSSYRVEGAELCGAYKGLFEIADWYSNGVLEILPSSIGKLKAGKKYTLSVKYTIKDAYGEGGEKITVMSNTFTIKPKQSVPKVTSSAKQLTLYASAKGESKGETMSLYVPHEYKKGCYAIQDAVGSLDVNKDGRADLVVTTTDIYASSGQAVIKVYVRDADAVKAAAKGTTYKIPVTVRCVGRDGVSRDASTTVRVIVKK